MAAAVLNSGCKAPLGPRHAGMCTTSGRTLASSAHRARPFHSRRRSFAPPRALGSGFGDQYTQSPFAMMDRQMQLMNEQMRAMDREFVEMDQMLRRDMEDTLQSSRRLTEQINREVDQELQRAREESTVTTFTRPNIQIERSEQRAPGSYRYYESIQIRSGYATPYQTLAAEQGTLSAGPSAIGLAVALILAGAWAAVTAIFHQNYDATTFKPEARWRLYALWPLLLIFSPKFREQFLVAFQMRASRATPGQGDGEQGGRG